MHSWSSASTVILLGLVPACGTTRQPMAALLAASQLVPAQEPAPTPGGGDKSGTDPTLFLRTAGVRNEYQSLRGDNWVDLTTASYIEPFADGTMNVRLKAPFAVADIAGDTDAGLGDLAARYNWRAHLDPQQALLVSTEVVADTATDDALGRGKWIAQPSVTYARFLSPSAIFAPAYQHNISVDGGSRRDVNESVFDFYFVLTAADKKSWVTIDPAVVVDWENGQDTPITLEVQYGRNLGTFGGGALNFFVQPGVGIGDDRPYEWNLDIGFTLVGF